MTSPFDDEDATFLVLAADSGTLCLWPSWADVPDGWTIAHGPSERLACLGWIEASVT